jgi:hypothetical protein
MLKQIIKTYKSLIRCKRISTVTTSSVTIIIGEFLLKKPIRPCVFFTDKKPWGFFITNIGGF